MPVHMLHSDLTRKKHYLPDPVAETSWKVTLAMENLLFSGNLVAEEEDKEALDEAAVADSDGDGDRDRDGNEREVARPTVSRPRAQRDKGGSLTQEQLAILREVFWDLREGQLVMSQDMIRFGHSQVEGFTELWAQLVATKGSDGKARTSIRNKLKKFCQTSND